MQMENFVSNKNYTDLNIYFLEIFYKVQGTFKNVIIFTCTLCI